MNEELLKFKEKLASQKTVVLVCENCGNFTLGKVVHNKFTYHCICGHCVGWEEE